MPGATLEQKLIALQIVFGGGQHYANSTEGFQGYRLALIANAGCDFKIKRHPVGA